MARATLNATAPKATARGSSARDTKLLMDAGANVNMQEYAKWLKKNYDFTIATSAGP